MTRTAAVWMLLILVTLGCNLIEVVPPGEQLQDEIPLDAAPGEQVADNGENQEEPTPEPPTATPTPEPPTPTPTSTATPTQIPYFLQSISLCPPGGEEGRHGCCPHRYAATYVLTDNICAPAISYGAGEPAPTPRHGLLIAFILPLLVLGLPWVIIEYFVVRYVQPRGFDLSTVRIKAQDGLFIEAAISLTARRSLTLASTRMTWGRVREVVEKILEQELIYQALTYPTLEELELNLKNIAEGFKDLPIVRELSDDFGLEVMRFNIESRFPQETMDAINRKAEASAGGTAYLAFAAAAHLDPDSPESRQLYTVYQETTGRVDAARNLGGGLTHIAEVFNPKNPRRESGENNDDDSQS